MDHDTTRTPISDAQSTSQWGADKRIYLALNEPEAMGGVQRVVDVLTGGFRDRGYSVEIVGIRRSRKSSKADRSNSGVMYPFLPMPVPTSLRNLINKGGMKLERLFAPGQWAYSRGLKKALDARPGHVIAMDVFAAELVAKVPRQEGYGRLVQYHNSFGAIAGTKDLARLVRISGRVDALLALTSEDADRFREVTNSPVFPMPNPLPFSRAPRSGPRPQRVVSVGRLVPHKGFGLLIKSWSELPSITRGKWELRIIGDGPEMANLQAAAVALGMEDSIVFAGPSDDIESELQNAEVLVLASEYDGFGMVLLEAMSQSVACIATDSGAGPRDLISQSSGLLIEVGNVTALTEALSQMVGNPEIRLQSATAGFEASKDFEISGIVRRWEELLELGAASDQR